MNVHRTASKGAAFGGAVMSGSRCASPGRGGGTAARARARPHRDHTV